MKKHKWLIFILILFFSFPIICHASTYLVASTQKPIQSNNFYIRLAIDYGDSLLIKEAHYKITYDPTLFKFVSLQWTQARGNYDCDDNGTITIDFSSETSPWQKGSAFVIEFKTLSAGNTSPINVSENGVGYYSDGNPVAQSYAGIQIDPEPANQDTYLRSLKVENYIISPTFAKTKNEYSLVVPSNVNKINVIATKNNNTQTISGDGEYKLQYGLNRITVIVTSQSKDQRAYLINVTRTDDRTGDVSLKSLLVSNTDISYDKEATSYEATVSKSVDKVIISATPNDPAATLYGTGEKELEIGRNEFELTVVSNKNRSQTYKITIIRSNKELEKVVSSNQLSLLRINGYNIDVSKTSFNYVINSGIDALDIEATPKSKTATYEVLDNEKFKTGFNIVTVKVNEIDGTSTDYKIVVYKEPESATLINSFDEIEDFEKDYVIDLLDSVDKKIDKSIVKNIVKNKTNLYVNSLTKSNALVYQVRLKNFDFDTSEDLDLSFKQKDNYYVTNIPSGQEMTLYMGDLDGVVYKIYTYNEGEPYTLLTEGVSVNNGFINFITNGKTNYIITTQTLIHNEKTTIDKVLSILKYVGIGFGVLVVILVISKFSKKKKMPGEIKNNGPQY